MEVKVHLSDRSRKIYSDAVYAIDEHGNLVITKATKFVASLGKTSGDTIATWAKGAWDGVEIVEPYKPQEIETPKKAEATLDNIFRTEAMPRTRMEG